VTSLYVGGGTPSSIGIDATALLLGKLSKILPLRKDHPGNFEFTIEVNPESVTQELLGLYHEMGVNRLSVGVQTFSDSNYTRIGRVGTPEQTRRALEMIADAWDGEFSLDLISALPGQTIKSGLADVREALSYAPHHISLYTLTIEPGTPLHNDLKIGKIKPPGDSEITVWERQILLLEDSGYDRYEISNYALPGCRSRHNMSYWHMLPYLGCGPAAVSTLPSTAGPVRIENHRSLRYFKDPLIPPADDPFTSDTKLKYGESYEHISPAAFFLEHLMVGLRLSDGIERSRIETIFGIDPLIPLRRTLEKWQESVEIDAKHLKLTKAGRNFLDGFLQDAAFELDEYPFPIPAWP
jgi:oxygen-independent coproporphyrinogen III oxidase